MSQGRGPVVDLMRPAPGVARCCICFEAWPIDELWIDLDGQRWDICVPCAFAEHPVVSTWPGHECYNDRGPESRAVDSGPQRYPNDEGGRLATTDLRHQG